MRLVLTGVIATAVAVTLPHHVLPMEGSNYWVVIGLRQNAFLNIRDGPSINARKIGTIPYDGHGIVNLGCQSQKDVREQHLWCHIRYSAVEGWVAGQYLTKADSPTEVSDPSIAGGHASETRSAAPTPAESAAPFPADTPSSRSEVTPDAQNPVAAATAIFPVETWIRLSAVLVLLLAAFTFVDVLAGLVFAIPAVFLAHHLIGWSWPVSTMLGLSLPFVLATLRLMRILPLSLIVFGAPTLFLSRAFLDLSWTLAIIDSVVAAWFAPMAIIRTLERTGVMDRVRRYYTYLRAKTIAPEIALPLRRSPLLADIVELFENDPHILHAIRTQYPAVMAMIKEDPSIAVQLRDCLRITDKVNSDYPQIPHPDLRGPRMPKEEEALVEQLRSLRRGFPTLMEMVEQDRSSLGRLIEEHNKLRQEIIRSRAPHVAAASSPVTSEPVAHPTWRGPRIY